MYPCCGGGKREHSPAPYVLTWGSTDAPSCSNGFCRYVMDWAWRAQLEPSALTHLPLTWGYTPAPPAWIGRWAAHCRNTIEKNEKLIHANVQVAWNMVCNWIWILIWISHIRVIEKTFHPQLIEQVLRPLNVTALGWGVEASATTVIESDLSWVCFSHAVHQA